MTEPITQEELAELKRLCEKASPGPWRHDEGSDLKNKKIPLWKEIVSEYSKQRPLVTLSATVWRPQRFEMAISNADFICASRETLPRLIAEVERLREDEERALDAGVQLTLLANKRKDKLQAALAKIKELSHEFEMRGMAASGLERNAYKHCAEACETAYKELTDEKETR